MSRQDRVRALWDSLESAQGGLTAAQLMVAMGKCAEATFYRALADWRERGFEIPCDSRGLYSLSLADHEKRAREAGLGLEESAALLLLQDRMIMDRRRGKSTPALDALGKVYPDRLRSLFDGVPAVLKGKVRWMPHRGRAARPDVFSALLDAIAKGRRVEIEHGQIREISPARIVSYRDSWYVEAWCHLRDEARRFALDRIVSTRLLDSRIETQVKDFFKTWERSSFGIFAGDEEFEVILDFRGAALKFVQGEVWHAKQKSEMLEDGAWRLSFPGALTPELIATVLSFGAQVQVIAPAELKERVVQELRANLHNYEV